MLILIFLWLFQIVFLDNFYQKIKTENIKSCANVISTYIDNENFSLDLNNLAIQNSLCIRIFDSNFSEIYSAQSFPDCIIHRISYKQLQKIYTSCQKSNTPITQIFNMDYMASSKKMIDYKKIQKKYLIIKKIAQILIIYIILSKPANHLFPKKFLKI